MLPSVWSTLVETLSASSARLICSPLEEAPPPRIGAKAPAGAKACSAKTKAVTPPAKKAQNAKAAPKQPLTKALPKLPDSLRFSALLSLTSHD